MKLLTQFLIALTLAFMSVSGLAREGTYTHIHTDHLGSPIMATDEAGEVLWRKNYQPFGEEEEKKDFQESMGYAGHMVEQDSGLVYMQGRWYHPGMGRFLAPDPVKYTDENPVMSFNRYAYANNNPYKYNDPDGEFINFAVKFVADVAMGAAINYMTTGSMDLGAAIQDSAMGVLNPAKSLQKMQKLAKIMKKGDKSDSAIKQGGEETVDLYRAVSPAEFDDIVKTGQFNLGPSGFGKQFGRDFDEILKLSDHLPDTSAIIKAKVPKSALDGLDHTPVDRHILKGGTVTVQPEKLEQFNKSVQSIEHVF